METIKYKQFEFNEIEEVIKYKSIIESLLFVSGDKLSLKDISNAIELNSKETIKILNEMIFEYENDVNRGIKLININGEFQFVTKEENSEYIQKLLRKNKRQSLSQASLESLAIIAYKQPITRIDIDEIRGVKSDSAIQRLIEKEIIKEVGRLEVPGRPIIYGTTDEFLRQFGLTNLKDLPSLDNFKEILEDEIDNELKFEDEVAIENEK